MPRTRQPLHFRLQNFRPSVDSKGYVTVNASQILGHLDFSLGLIGSFAHNVLNLNGQGNRFDVENYLTPQLQFAIGLFKWVELGPVVAGAHHVRLALAEVHQPGEHER